MWYRQCLSRVFELVVQVNLAKIMILEFLGIRVSSSDGRKQKVNSVPLPAMTKAIQSVCVNCGTGMPIQGVQSCFLPYCTGAHLHAAGQHCWQYPGST